MGCNGRRGENEVRVGLPRGVKWCKSEGVFCPEGEVRVGLSRGLKWCKSEGVICSEGVK